jgi:tetratricopeptide (TPR) repeat protein
MKRSIFIFVALMATVYAKPAYDPYTENMLAAKTIADSALTEPSLLSAANYFIRIAAMNPDQWLPHYFAAYCYARISHLNKDAEVCDQWVDRAQEEVDKAYEISPQNSEVLVLKGFVLQARMNVNPLVRGYQFFEESMGYFNKAIEINPDNPRAYLWKGVNLLHTPEQFGGGKQTACPLIRVSINKFESLTVSDPLAPAWGYDYAREIVKTCQ